MTGSTPPITSGGGEGSSIPMTREQLEGYVTALKSMIKEHNSRRDTVEPLRLDFEDDITPDKGEPVDKKKEIVTGSKVKDEDLAKPFKEVSKSPFTRRIIEFSAPEHKMPTHIKLYDGSTDPQDHLNRFTGAAGHGEWPMPVWCRMFQQTLDGKARGWFDGLPPGSIDEWAAFRDQFESRFSLHKACVKDPTEIAKIVRKANETLPEFKERWTTETGFIQGAPEIMRISSFMNGCKCPELAKRFADTIPKTVEEMMVRVDDFVGRKRPLPAPNCPGENIMIQPGEPSRYSQLKILIPLATLLSTYASNPNLPPLKYNLRSTFSFSFSGGNVRDLMLVYKSMRSTEKLSSFFLIVNVFGPTMNFGHERRVWHVPWRLSCHLCCNRRFRKYKTKVVWSWEQLSYDLGERMLLMGDSNLICYQMNMHQEATISGINGINGEWNRGFEDFK